MTNPLTLKQRILKIKQTITFQIKIKQINLKALRQQAALAINATESQEDKKDHSKFQKKIQTTVNETIKKY